MTFRESFLVRCLLAVLLSGTTIPEAMATWSIIAIHPRTGTIGVAAASCSGGVFGIQSVVPGTGVVIVQADSNSDARSAAVKMLRERLSPDAILARMSDATAGYSPQRQQYAVFASGSDGGPRLYTGADVPDVKGSAHGEHFSVQGNTLASDKVITRTATALGDADWPDDLAMAQALMRALRAGAAAGGDRRCGTPASNSAFISLHRPADPSNAPWVSLSINRIPPGTASGTEALDTLFSQWLRDGMRHPSTAIFLVPGKETAEPAR